MNRYNAIKRLNKSNFINLLSVCSEETLQEIFPVKKHDLLKLISDRLTKAELQDIMYNLEEIETEDIESIDDVEDTMSVIRNCVDGLQLKNKESLNKLMQDLYGEALMVETV